MVAVQQGQAAPAMTPRLRHQFLDELTRWHVRTVIIGPMGNRAAMRLFFTRLLDHPPVWSGGVDVRRHADHIVAVADQPSGKDAVTPADLHARREQIAATVTEAARGPVGPRPPAGHGSAVDLQTLCCLLGRPTKRSAP